MQQSKPCLFSQYMNRAQGVPCEPSSFHYAENPEQQSIPKAANASRLNADHILQAILAPSKTPLLGLSLSLVSRQHCSNSAIGAALQRVSKTGQQRVTSKKMETAEIFLVSVW